MHKHFTGNLTRTTTHGRKLNTDAVFSCCYQCRKHLDVLRVIFGEYNSDIVKTDILTMQKISRRLQIFVLRGLAGM